MAVINDYPLTNAGAVAADADVAARFSGNKVKSVFVSFEVAAADSDGSIYRVARLSPQAIIKSIKIKSDAIAGATVYSIGVYKPLSLDGSVVSIACLVANTDINAGYAAFTELFAPDAANVGKPLYALAGITDANQVKYGTLDVAVVGVTVGTAAGTIALVIEYVDGV